MLSAVLFAGTAFVVMVLGDSPAHAAAGCAYSVSGSVTPQTAHVGDPMRASASLVTSTRNCSSTTVSIWATGSILSQSLGSCSLPGRGGVCIVPFTAEHGMSTIEARVPGSSPVVIGSITVLDAPRTSSAPPPTTVPPPTTSAAASTTTATTATTTSASASATTTKPKPTITRSNPALKLPNSPWESGAAPITVPSPSDSGGATDGGIPLSNEVTHGSGGVGVPTGMLLASVVLLAGLFGAVVRMIIRHTRSESTA